MTTRFVIPTVIIQALTRGTRVITYTPQEGVILLVRREITKTSDAIDVNAMDITLASARIGPQRPHGFGRDK